MITLTGQVKSTQTIYRYAMTKIGKDLKDQYTLESRSQWKNEPLEGDLDVDIKIYHGDKRKRDIDNFHKLILDALSGVVWYDDKQIVKLTTEKFYDKENPRAEVIINKR